MKAHQAQIVVKVVRVHQAQMVVKVHHPQIIEEVYLIEDNSK